MVPHHEIRASPVTSLSVVCHDLLHPGRPLSAANVMHLIWTITWKRILMPPPIQKEIDRTCNHLEGEAPNMRPATAALRYHFPSLSCFILLRDVCCNKGHEEEQRRRGARKRFDLDGLPQRQNAASDLNSKELQEPNLFAFFCMWQQYQDTDKIN